MYVGKGKGSDALIKFSQSLKKSKCRIEAIAMNMSKAYISHGLKIIYLMLILYWCRNFTERMVYKTSKATGVSELNNNPRCRAFLLNAKLLSLC